MKYSLIAILVSGVLLSGPALAGTQQQSDDQKVRVSELERRADALQSRINRTPKVSASERSELSRQQREIRRMIERLESGGAVDPQEMERIR